jgi:hypothetical protein
MKVESPAMSTPARRQETPAQRAAPQPPIGEGEYLRSEKDEGGDHTDQQAKYGAGQIDGQAHHGHDAQHLPAGCPTRPEQSEFTPLIFHQRLGRVVGQVGSQKNPRNGQKDEEHLRPQNVFLGRLYRREQIVGHPQLVGIQFFERMAELGGLHLRLRRVAGQGSPVDLEVDLPVDGQHVPLHQRSRPARGDRLLGRGRVSQPWGQLRVEDGQRHQHDVSGRIEGGAGQAWIGWRKQVVGPVHVGDADDLHRVVRARAGQVERNGIADPGAQVGAHVLAEQDAGRAK